MSYGFGFVGMGASNHPLNTEVRPLLGDADVTAEDVRVRRIESIAVNLCPSARRQRAGRGVVDIVEDPGAVLTGRRRKSVRAAVRCFLNSAERWIEGESAARFRSVVDRARLVEALAQIL